MPITVHQGEKAHEFLRKHTVGVLATVCPDGEPHAAAVYYLVDGNNDVFFITRTGTRKAKNLAHNPHAVLLVYEAAVQTSVEVSGHVAVVADAAEVDRLLSKIIYASLDNSGSDEPPFVKLHEGEYIAYRLTPQEVRMAVFSKPTSGDYNTFFSTFTPAM